MSETIKVSKSCGTCKYYRWRTSKQGYCERFKLLPVKALFICPEYREVKGEYIAWLKERASQISDPAVEGWVSAYRAARRVEGYIFTQQIEDHIHQLVLAWESSHPRPKHSYEPGADPSARHNWSRERARMMSQSYRAARKTLGITQKLKLWKEEWERKNPRPKPYTTPEVSTDRLSRFQEISMMSPE